MALPPTNYEFGEADFITESGITEMQSAVFPLVVITAGVTQCVGTGFCVAGAGVLATARHVIRDVNKLISEANGRAGVAAVCYANLPGDEDAVVSITVPISDVCAHPDERFDFALLTATVPEVEGQRIRFPSLPIDFSMPQLGDQIILMGYTAFTLERPSGDTVRITQPLSCPAVGSTTSTRSAGTASSRRFHVWAPTHDVTAV